MRSTGSDDLPIALEGNAESDVVSLREVRERCPIAAERLVETSVRPKTDKQESAAVSCRSSGDAILPSGWMTTAWASSWWVKSIVALPSPAEGRIERAAGVEAEEGNLAGLETRRTKELADLDDLAVGLDGDIPGVVVATLEVPVLLSVATK